jgi:hypothetical protein
VPSLPTPMRWLNLSAVLHVVVSEAGAVFTVPESGLALMYMYTFCLPRLRQSAPLNMVKKRADGYSLARAPFPPRYSDIRRHSRCRIGRDNGRRRREDS